MAAQRHPFPSDGGAGAARVGAGGSSGHVTAPRAMPKASQPYASENVRAHGGEAAGDMSSRQRTNLFVGDAVAPSDTRRWVPAFAGTTVGVGRWVPACAGATGWGVRRSHDTGTKRIAAAFMQ